MGRYALVPQGTRSPIPQLHLQIPLGQPTDRSSGSLVIAHFMVGNVASYTCKTGPTVRIPHIALASSKGLDGFVLNLGSDSWQPDKKYITTYSAHPNVLQFAGKMLISTFSGEKCTFGQLGRRWMDERSKTGPPVHFIPAFFVDPTTLGTYQSIDGAFNWNGGWPQSKVDTSFDTDTTYVSSAVSPWFFTHYGADSFNKNWIYNFDDWLFSERWEVLIKNREQVPIVEGSQPNSQAWVNGFDYQGWLDVMEYYIAYYKTGAAPTIAKDSIFLGETLSHRCHGAGPSWSATRRGEYHAARGGMALKYFTQDWAANMLWAQFHLTQPADLTLTVPVGISKQKLELKDDCNIAAKITRGGSDVVTFAPAGMNFSTKPPSYNFNAFVAASPP
ncbi:glycoside hydrolase family 71 protein [Mycena latifolia]|nr:glycoside hydrolase family 71 protein [Mycena latifolia]